jgi:mRNA-degrading endonuclease YafQ of YafQ-DinJ toxin-antitoxin module
MPTLEASRRFLRAYDKATKRDRERGARINKALELFRTDPDHPSLNFERLAGSDLFSIRIDRGDRIILRRRDGEWFELVDLGSHDIYRRYP